MRDALGRRRLLAGLAAVAGSGVAGCVDAPARSGAADADGPADSGAADTADRTTTDPIGSFTLPVPKEEIIVAAPKDRIPAITDPAFADRWAGAEIPGADDGETVRLPDTDPVIGVARDGAARAYPLRVLNPHEVVNDEFGGPLLVTYCPICGSSVVAERLVNGRPTAFGVSGRLWRNDLVMYDRLTESFWSQIVATAIRGSAVGQRLAIVPSSLTTWGDWRGRHPDSTVLLPPPHSNTVRGRELGYDYALDWYPEDEERQLIGYDATGGSPRLKTLVLGVVSDGEAMAYPFFVVDEVGVVEDAVGDLPVVVTTTPGGSLVGYDRRLDGRPLSFAPAGDAHLRAGGSRWRRSDGRAVDGPHAGRTLRPAASVPAMYWHAWKGFNPETGLYGVAGEGG